MTFYGQICGELNHMQKMRENEKNAKYAENRKKLDFLHKNAIAFFKGPYL